MTKLLACRSVSKRHVSLSGAFVSAIEDVSFDLTHGELLSIVGPSGSGKSTILNLIAGVYQQTKGSIEFLTPKHPRIGYVLQSNALFPWRTVRRNLAYSWEIQGIQRSKHNQMASDICTQLGLNPVEFLDKYPRELSGGEQRRVAIGMAVARTPDLLLLDEPSSQLDFEAKWAIQSLVQDIALQHKLAVICVTHDLEEAVFIGDRVMMMREGRVRDVIDINLSRPRHNGVRTSDSFNDYRRTLLRPDAG